MSSVKVALIEAFSLEREVVEGKTSRKVAPPFADGCNKREMTINMQDVLDFIDRQIELCRGRQLFPTWLDADLLSIAAIAFKNLAQLLQLLYRGCHDAHARLWRV